MPKFLPFLLLLTACHVSFKPTHKPAEPKADNRVEVLHGEYQSRLAALTQDSVATSGWPDAKDCDATLWAGVFEAAGGEPQIGLAEYSPGEIHRRPQASGECYPKESASTVSNDMLLGYLWGRWTEINLDALQRLAEYGEKNNWTMGKGDAARTVFRPNGYGLLGRMIYALSAGKDDHSYRKIPPLFLPVAEDYEKHLMVEGILLNSAVNEYLRKHQLDGALGFLDVSSQDLDRLKELSDSDPGDALFAAAYGTYTGDFDHALDLLLDDQSETPSYVRGGEAYPTVWWLRAAKLVLDRYP